MIDLNAFATVPLDPDSPRWIPVPRDAPAPPPEGVLRGYSAFFGIDNPKFMTRKPKDPDKPDFTGILFVIGTCTDCGDFVAIPQINGEVDPTRHYKPCRCHPRYDELNLPLLPAIPQKLRKDLRTQQTEYDDRTTARGSYRSRTIEYNAWTNLKKDPRCNPRWRRSFVEFFEEVGARPGGCTALVKQAGARVLTAKTVAWGTRADAAANRQRQLTSADGETLGINAWAAKLRIQPQTVWARLRAGYSEAEAVAVGNQRKPKPRSAEGERLARERAAWRANGGRNPLLGGRLNIADVLSVTAEDIV